MGTKTFPESTGTAHYHEDNKEPGNVQVPNVTDETEESTKPTTIKTLEDAARFAYGLYKTRNKIKEIEEIANKEIAHWQDMISQVEKWREEVLKPLRNKEEYFTSLLTMFHQKEFNSAANDKARAKLKSIKLPYGITLVSREQPVKYEIVDEAALLEYAKANGQVEVVEKPKWSEIKKKLGVGPENRIFDDNGEEVRFVKAIHQERKFEVK